jgi:hypothetical protein
VREHHRVVVHVDDPAGRVDRLRQIAAGRRAGQAGADVDELPDARLDGEEAHRPLVEGEHTGHDRGHRGRRPEHRRGRPAIDLETVPAAVQEIRHPVRIGHGGINPAGLCPLGCVELPVVGHRVPSQAASQRRGGDVK